MALLIFLVVLLTAIRPHDAGVRACVGKFGMCKTKRRKKKKSKTARSYVPQHLRRFIEQPIAPPLPTLTVQDFENDPAENFRKFLRPFKLKAAFDNEPAKKKWNKAWFGPKTKYAREVVDFYPKNMLQQGTHPYLYRLATAVKRMSSLGFLKSQESQYLMWNMRPEPWDELGKDVHLPEAFNTDAWWQDQCLSNQTLREEFFIKTHWSMLLMGTRGAGMFNHSDSLRTSSWQAQVSGAKWWYVCGHMWDAAPTGEIITGDFKCFEDVVREGEILFYPSEFYHQTFNVEDRSISYSGTQLDARNYRFITNEFFEECARGKWNYKFSGKLCDVLDDCYKLWDDRFRGGRAPIAQRWRDVANQKSQAERDAVPPTENNYNQNPVNES